MDAVKRIAVTVIGIVTARVVAEFVVQELRKYELLDTPPNVTAK